MAYIPLFEEHAVWRNVFWVSYWTWFAMELWILSRDRRPAKGEVKDRGSRFALMVFIPAGLIGAFYVAFRVPATRIAAAPDALFWSGIAITWIGMALRMSAVI